ncbi:MAG: hypothetical protein GY856_24650 [bacterium]|nr:hypothetical protein [bacterium]
MSETLLTGQSSEMTEMPRTTWEGHLAAVPEGMARRLAFMSEDHHRVRYHAVEQIARLGAALPPAAIARDLELAPERVTTILDELEKNLFFLVRNDAGAVEWAYPVTAAQTPHRLVFSTGERLHGA